MATTLRDIGFRLGYELDKSSEQAVESSIQSLKSMATKLLGAIGIGFSFSAFRQITEEFNSINDQINYAVKGLADQKEAQQAILDAANETKTSYADMADTVTQLVQVNKDLFPLDEAVEFSTLTQKLLLAAGKSESEATALQSTIARVFQTGDVTSLVLRRLYTQAPEVINTIADSMGVASDELYDLADEGVLTATTLKDAIMSAADTIEEDFSNLDYNISDALLNMRNKWGYFLDDLNSTFGITETIAKGLVKVNDVAVATAKRIQTRLEWLVDKLGGAENVLKLVAVAAGAILTAFAFTHLSAGLESVSKVLGKINVKMLAIIAVIVIIALLVEDFINFMQGNDSVIGELLEKAGVDVEGVREKIETAWETIKAFLLNVWETIKSAAATVWDALKEFWAENSESIMESLQSIWESIKTILSALWDAITAVAKAVFGALQAFWAAWGDKILATFSSIWETVQKLFTIAVDIITGIFEAFAALFSGDWDGLWESVKSIFSSVWEFIQTFITGVLNALWTLFGDIFTNIWNTVDRIITGIHDSIVDGFQAAIDWITALPAQAVQWGADIIQGIVDGITGAVSKVKDAVSGVADTIKGFLGFSEPEEGPLSDFSTYMPDMIDLMSQGIEKGREKVRLALGDLTGDMSIVAQSGTVSAATAATASNSVASNRNVVQNVNITNEFNGDRAGQAKSADAMDKASNDATSQMARALSFARG